MDINVIERFNQLMLEAELLEEGPHQIAAFEEAVRLADTYQNLDLAWRGRRRLMGAAMCGGQPDLLMVAFTWCLAQSDRDPERFPQNDMLWAYRWVIFELSSFPQVPRSQFDALLNEMEQRYRAAGSTLRGYWLLRNRLETRMGNLDAAHEAYQRFQQCKRDDLSDSPEVEQAFKALYLLPRGDDKATLEACAPILRNVYRSQLYQGIALSITLAPLLRLKRVPEAMSYHLRGYRLVSRNPRYIDRVGNHIAFLALTDNLSRAFTLVTRHLPIALTTVDLGARFEFFLACRLLLDIVRDSGKTSVKLQLNNRFPLFREHEEYPLDEMVPWFDDQLNDLAQRFDERNGNQFCRRQIAALAELKRHATRFPLPARSRADLN